MNILLLKRVIRDKGREGIKGNKTEGGGGKEEKKFSVVTTTYDYSVKNRDGQVNKSPLIKLKAYRSVLQYIH